MPARKGLPAKLSDRSMIFLAVAAVLVAAVGIWLYFRFRNDARKTLESLVGRDMCAYALTPGEAECYRSKHGLRDTAAAHEKWRTDGCKNDATIPVCEPSGSFQGNPLIATSYYMAKDQKVPADKLVIETLPDGIKDNSDVNYSFKWAPTDGDQGQPSYFDYGTTGDWRISSVSPEGKVTLQEAGGSVTVGTNQPSSEMLLTVQDGIEVRAAPRGTGSDAIQAPAAMLYGGLGIRPPIDSGNSNGSIFSTGRNGGLFLEFDNGVIDKSLVVNGDVVVLDENGNSINVRTAMQQTNMEINDLKIKVESGGGGGGGSGGSGGGGGSGGDSGGSGGEDDDLPPDNNVRFTELDEFSDAIVGNQARIANLAMDLDVVNKRVDALVGGSGATEMCIGTTCLRNNEICFGEGEDKLCLKYSIRDDKRGRGEPQLCAGESCLLPKLMCIEAQCSNSSEFK